MKRLVNSTAIAAVMALCGFVGCAHATTYLVSQNPYVPITNVNAPLYYTVAPSYPPTPFFSQNESGSNLSPIAVERSPYELNNDGFNLAFYSVLAPGGQSGPAQVIYDLNGATTFAILWGSPDSYNNIAFYSGADAGGSQIGPTMLGSQTICYTTTCSGYAWDVVTFTAIDGTFGSVVLTDTGQAAFEFGLQVGSNQSQAPLPAAFWLFGTVIAGAAGASRMRRRRQLQTA